MVAQKSIELMSKEDLLKVNLWELYWNFLNSLQSKFGDELKPKLKTENLESWIGSLAGFFDENGTATGEYPELEEIYFQLPNHISLVRICISFGKTEQAYIDLIESNNMDVYYSPNNFSDTKQKIENLFSPETIAAVVEWLQTGELTEFAEESYEHN